jgi:hypothetical protein
LAHWVNGPPVPMSLGSLDHRPTRSLEHKLPRSQRPRRTCPRGYLIGRTLKLWIFEPDDSAVRHSQAPRCLRPREPTDQGVSDPRLIRPSAGQFFGTQTPTSSRSEAHMLPGLSDRRYSETSDLRTPMIPRSDRPRLQGAFDSGGRSPWVLWPDRAAGLRHLGPDTHPHRRHKAPWCAGPEASGGDCPPGLVNRCSDVLKIQGASVR